jgi:hypothetical protein
MMRDSDATMGHGRRPKCASHEACLEAHRCPAASMLHLAPQMHYARHHHISLLIIPF